MILNKAMLLSAGGDGAPEPGYVRASLTVGKIQPGMHSRYGFGTTKSFWGKAFGSLVPQHGYQEISCQYMMDAGASTVTATKPFYYEGRKYQGNNSDPAIAWKTLLGKTVEVWIQGWAKIRNYQQPSSANSRRFHSVEAA